MNVFIIITFMANIVTEKLTESKLKRLADHKYLASGSTLLDPIMQKFWNWFVVRLPLWFSPNCMTLVGLFCNIFTALILVYYSPDAKQQIPAWALLLCALGLFTYQTLDAMDGKQARRTGTNSPLGELFDHGCDAVSTIFVSLSVCEATQLGTRTNCMIVLCVFATALFYLAHWQTYVSGTLNFGKFDVTEAQFTIIIILVISALFGTDFWNKSVPIISNYADWDLKFVVIMFTALNASNAALKYCKNIFFGGVGKNGSTVAIPYMSSYPKLSHVQLKDLPILFSIGNEAFILYSKMIIILKGGVGKNGSSVAGTSILSPSIPILLVVISALTIFHKSPSNIFEEHLCLYLITFGLVTAKITNKLVVAHMSKSEISKLDSVFIGPLLLFLNQYFNTFINEYVLLWIALIYILVDFLYYSYSTCSQIADYLNILILSIQYARPTNQKQSSSRNSITEKSSNGRERHRPYNLRAEKR